MTRTKKIDRSRHEPSPLLSSALGLRRCAAPVRGAGPFSYEFLLDHAAGTPTDPSDDVFLGPQRVVREAGIQGRQRSGNSRNEAPAERGSRQASALQLCRRMLRANVARWATDSGYGRFVAPTDHDTRALLPVRIEDGVVTRPAAPWSPTVHAFLGSCATRASPACRSRSSSRAMSRGSGSSKATLVVPAGRTRTPRLGSARRPGCSDNPRNVGRLGATGDAHFCAPDVESGSAETGVVPR